MEEELIIQSTEDGSQTIYIPSLDEHYHSTKGALAESRHVYIDTCWRKAAAEFVAVRVFEVGFGTGLNAALTAEEALKQCKPTIYYSVELHPLDTSLTDTLAYDSLTPYFSAVNKAEWGREVEINPYFKLVKIVDNFLTMQLPGNINAIYYDAFAPEKQPEMWDDDVIRGLYDCMTPGGALATYCAKGIIRRRLQSVGFTVERLQGPPGGKREILRAVKK
ncbi:MAG: tRNA (5-methylaminomethyl-2-thiouridine)(34)-methyltransferase MnmD [Barnesiella sp.]|nr:tRNA (5-methylaminomethyl-2-thiouridine)(34)-methyltransferase MnmD [Bacteroidales bacterium]MBD5249131.1 tRNA (5-methylaminomethyl-2-thiouridine)(34)-methyltransferase MnmD [Barnesiella sp.]